MKKNLPLTVADLDLPLSRATPIGPRKPPKPPEANASPNAQTPSRAPSSTSAAPQTAPAGGFGGDSPFVWPQINPLGDGTSLPEFDPAWFSPPALREMVVSTAASLEVPIELAALTALGFLAGVVTYGTDGATIRVRNDWNETTNLYTIVALPSGSRKSATYDRFCAPIQAHEHLLEDRAKTEVSEALSKRRADEKHLAALEAKSGADPKHDGERQTLAHKLATEPVPTMPKLLADDVTAERLTCILSEQGGRIILASPEPDIIGLMQGRYTDHGAANLAPFLKGHTGEELRVDRMKGGTIRVPRALLSVVLCAQPDSLSELIADRKLQNRGLVNRFLIAVPRSNLGHRTGKGPAIPTAVSDAYAQMIHGVLGHGSGTYDPFKPPRVVTFTADALAALESFAREVEPMLAEGAALGDLPGWASKLPGAVARIAAVLALAANILTDEVEARFVEQAIHIGRFLQAHALAAYGAAGIDPDQKRAKRILKHIEGKRLTGFKKRDLHQNLKGGSHQLIRKAEDLDAALDLLEVNGYILRDDGERRSYTVNPALWGDPKPPTPPHP